MRNYVGDLLQVRGAERYILADGKGKGMNFLCVRNGLGLEAWISIDRAGDISRVNFKGDNMAFFSPCGYVAPEYYDKEGLGFLKSFTAGFCTTCGLTAVGSPCEDEGEVLGLHGTISNIPSRLLAINEDDEKIEIVFEIKDTVIFGRKLVLKRKYIFSYTENSIAVTDTVTNEADTQSPYMIFYHCNMGYPLVSENSVVKVPHNSKTARDENAQKYIESSLVMEKPQANYVERCYYYDIKETNGVAKAGIFNPDINKGVVFAFDKKELPCFTQWKMMGNKDYVLGLEPGNCTPDGRDVLRRENRLQFIQPDESRTTHLKFVFHTNETAFDKEF